MFPLLIATSGALLALAVVIRDAARAVHARKTLGGWLEPLQQAGKDAWLASALPFFGYIPGLTVLTILVGQKITIPVLVAAYLLRWGKYSATTAAAYVIAAWVLIVAFCDQVMGLLFHPSYLQLAVQQRLPNGFPDWLIF